ncbi:unnamed protein product, partial [Discosporangium mesarthrocarpum]
IHIVHSKDLFTDTSDTLSGVTEFAGLSKHQYTEDSGRNFAACEGFKLLREFMIREWYRPHNERLFNLLGVDLGWNKPRIGRES